MMSYLFILNYVADLFTEVHRRFYNSLDANKFVTSSLHPLCDSYSRPNKEKSIIYRTSMLIFINLCF